jgi:hypothetical protein
MGEVAWSLKINKINKEQNENNNLMQTLVWFWWLKNKGCVTLWPCDLGFKKDRKAKEELRKLKYFTMQKYNLQNNPLKETKILQDIIIL